MADAGDWLVVGLGNPGPSYARNRHNVGAMVVDALAAQWGVRLGRGKQQATEGMARRGDITVRLACPTTYMNLSGGPVAGLARYYKVSPEQVLVVHDELDLPFATLRLKQGGGEGGHNGLRSISASLGTKEYRRLRVGIGRPPGRMDAADFVLRDFSSTERKELDFLLPDACDVVSEILALGWERAQTATNTR
ncbi:MAG: aminoacyl-tRNA hydrolase [Kineosporiaceae bacterium]